MKRRSFVKASLLAPALPAIAHTALAGNTPPPHNQREYYVLRVYHLDTFSQQQIVQNYYEKAAIPAYNKIGVRPVGVFTEVNPEGQTRLFALIPYASAEAWAAADEQLMNDAAYVKAANDYLNAPATAPAFKRVESSLFHAFTGMPVMATPTPNQQRIFELRRYESPGVAAGLKKIEMFNEGGEMEIFKQTGLKAVFFGKSLIGDNQPNLTYMLQFEDMPAHDKAWSTFGSSPAWNKLKSVPDYADEKLISKIIATFLLPTAFSQI